MKKFSILFFLVICFNQSYSQNFNLGLGVGLNYSNLILENLPHEKSKFKIGFQINSIFCYNFIDKFGIRLEPGFTNKGTKTVDNLSEAKENLNYFNFPILIKYSPIKKLSILIGPEFLYLISAKTTYNGETFDSKFKYDAKTDIGISAGLIYNIFNKIDLGFRYNQGFISTIKDLRFSDENGIPTDKANLYNQGITISIMYMIK